MNSTLQPVLQPSTQPPTVPSPNKTMHPQGSPVTYPQPSGPVTQNPFPNTNMAHTHTPAQQNHFNHNVSTGSFNMGSIPSSNHPVASANQAAGTLPAQKNALSASNNVPPVSQSLPASGASAQQSVAAVQAQSSVAAAEPSVEKEKPQANGTPEKVAPPVEAQGNHVAPAPPVPSSPQAAEVPQLNSQTPPSKPQAPAAENPETVKLLVEDVAPPAASTVAAPEASATSATDVAPLTPQEDVPAATETPKEAPLMESDPLAIDTPPQEEEMEEEEVPAVAKEEPEKEELKQSPPVKREPSPAKTSAVGAARTNTRKTKAKAEPKTPLQKSPSAGKVKRQRIMTQHYQSPLPEIEIITKISSSTPRNKNVDDKLIYFYKNEFLAVRNAEGGFYLCQTAQNVYKSSSKIKIRWLSQDKADSTGEIYTPDFYDLTDFDCILTSLDLTRMDKGKYRLKPAEKERTDSILKRCLAVEKGEIVSPSLSEEHPDGLDLSLYKDEEQLKKKRKGTKRKGRPRSTSPKKTPATTPSKKSPEASKVRKVETKASAAMAKKPTAGKKTTTAEGSKKGAGRTARGRRKVESKSPVMDQKKAIVLAKIGRSNAAQAGTSRSLSKNAKSSKPVPSTSKAPKVSAPTASSSKSTTSRKTKRSTRK